MEARCGAHNLNCKTNFIDGGLSHESVQQDYGTVMSKAAGYTNDTHRLVFDLI